MARIRSLRPDGAHDIRTARVSRECRFHHLALKRVADDGGYFRATPRLLLGLLYPHDRDLGEARVSQMTAELADAGLVELWQTPDGPIGRLAGWTDVRDPFYEHIPRPAHSHLADLVAALQPVAAPVPDVLPLFPVKHADERQTHANSMQGAVEPEKMKQGVVESGKQEAARAAAAAGVDLSYAQQCTIAANAALEARFASSYKTLVASVEAETAEGWQREGVPLPVALQAIREAVARYRPGPHSRYPRSLRYFSDAVREAGERELVRSGAVPRPETPSEQAGRLAAALRAQEGTAACG